MTDQEFISAVQAAVAAPAADSPLAKALLGDTIKRPCFVIGRNEQAAALIGRLRIDGLVDDFAQPGSAWKGLPALSIAQLPADAVIINCSTSISPVAVEQRIKAAGLIMVSLHELIDAASGEIERPAFVQDQLQDWRDFETEWGALFASLADEESRRTLLDVARYRATADARFMAGYAVRLQEQYFEPFLDLRAEAFVDAGGFDGDTTEEFCRRDPDYRKVYLFEPSQRNMDAAKTRLSGRRDIVFRSEALSDEAGVMSFDAEAGSASAATAGQGEDVQVTTLDEAVAEPVSFVKMDLEGWELRALRGCARHIGEDRPKLAIAVYHRARDFRDVWRYARSIHPDYKVYLRHYTQGWSETVMSFV